VEAVDPEIASKVAIVCRDLRKAYYKKRKWWQFWDIEGGRGQASKQQWKPESEIIKGLNLNLYEGQLFAFVVSGSVIDLFQTSYLKTFLFGGQRQNCQKVS
jgi:hypothetical protein